MTIKKRNIRELIRMIRGINGVEGHKERFWDTINQAGGSMHCVMDIIQNLVLDKLTEWV